MSLPALAAHLWQTTWCVAAAALLVFFLRRNSARLRHAVLLIASLKFLLPFSVLVSFGGALSWRLPAPSRPLSPLVVAIDTVAQPFHAPRRPEPPPSTPSGYLPSLLYVIWISGSLAIAASSLVRWLRLRAIVRAASPLPLAFPIPVRSSSTMLEPGIFGIVRPVLLLPQGIFDRLPSVQLDAILAHELCHVRRRDNLIAALHMCVETLFWFHPLTWWLGRRMLDERERACDEQVLRTAAEPRVYAQTILNVCRLYVASPALHLAGVSRSHLEQRIEAIMNRCAVVPLGFTKKAALSLTAVAALAVPILLGFFRGPSLQAQSRTSAAAANARFEVASVKPCKDTGPDGGRGGGSAAGRAATSPGRLDMPCQPLRQFIRVAFVRANFRATGTDNLRLEGGPSWIDSERYQIAAKAEGPASLEIMEGPMLQKLLEERFRLKTHRETRESEIYVLNVARGGIKMKPSAPGSCIPQDPAADSFPPPEPGAKPLCGEAGITMSRHRISFRLASATLRELALNLGSWAGRPVVDRTGITEKFDFQVQFAPPNVDPADELAAPSLPSALAPLGLKLDSSRGPRDYLVIDHVERPSAN